MVAYPHSRSDQGQVIGCGSQAPGYGAQGGTVDDVADRRREELVARMRAALRRAPMLDEEIVDVLNRCHDLEEAFPDLASAHARANWGGVRVASR